MATLWSAFPRRSRLVDWLAVNGLAVDSCTTAQLELARELRESIHAAATAAAIQDALPASAVQVINDCSAQGRAAAILTPEGERRWRLGSASCVEDALSVIAADAISIIAGERDGKIGLVRIADLPSRLLRHQPKPHPQMV